MATHVLTLSCPDRPGLVHAVSGWVVDAGIAVGYEGTYREWRAAVSEGWTVATAAVQVAARLSPTDRESPRPPAPVRAAAAARHQRVAPGDTVTRSGTVTRSVTTTRTGARRERLSKDTYRRRKGAAEAELTRLGLRKGHLELALGNPAVQANFVELRRITSELADVDEALRLAEEAWLELEEQAP